MTSEDFPSFHAKVQAVKEASRTFLNDGQGVAASTSEGRPAPTHRTDPAIMRTLFEAAKKAATADIQAEQTGKKVRPNNALTTYMATHEPVNGCFEESGDGVYGAASGWKTKRRGATASW